MATISSSLVVIVLFSLITKGLCGGCGLDKIEIATTRSGKEIAGKPEWNVVLKNTCKCTQQFISVSCKGFQTMEPVDPNKILPHGDKCLVKNGGPLKGGESVSFSYVADPPTIFIPVSSLVIPC